MHDSPALNLALDAGGIAETYRRDGRVHIPDVLTADSAARVHRCLEQETPFALLTGSGRAQVWPASLLTPQKEAELMTAAFSQARENFHYLYDAHNMSEDGIAYPDPAHYLAAVTQFLNSAPLLDFVRTIAGAPAIAFASAQATRYRPGHFLSQHDDGNEGGKRIAAYVLNMTPNWRLDWGGALLFSDRPGHIAEGYPPAFNALNMFSVPQTHLVGLVSPFAGAHRLSITGWFKSR
jgi:SM-20-related protein